MQRLKYVSFASFVLALCVMFFGHNVTPQVDAEPQTVTEAKISAPVVEVAEEKPVTIEVIGTAYCPCGDCCGEWAKNRPIDENGKPIVYTATMTVAKQGRTIAVDPTVIPLGAEVEIDGHTYVAEDTGSAIKGNRVDIYFDNHAAAAAFGVQTLTVVLK